MRNRQVLLWSICQEGSTCSNPVLVPRVAHCLCLGDIWRLLGVDLGVDNRADCNEWGSQGDAAVVFGREGWLTSGKEEGETGNGISQEAHEFQSQKPLNGVTRSEMERLLVAKTPTGSRGKETGQNHGC